MPQYRPIILRTSYRKFFIYFFKTILHSYFTAKKNKHQDVLFLLLVILHLFLIELKILQESRVVRSSTLRLLRFCRSRLLGAAGGLGWVGSLGVHTGLVKLFVKSVMPRINWLDQLLITLSNYFGRASILLEGSKGFLMTPELSSFSILLSPADFTFSTDLLL